ncbi:MAG TPA: cytochrome b/b6 domain-containing protein [Steroidobacteraceae bacterium]|nr:cytochrome b/b6 domain-containing protein [Steroidobacteraceae bacterium]
MSEPAGTRRVWDLPVRVVHWLLVFGIAGSYATHKLGVAYFKYHLWFGYLVVVLAAFRIAWGVAGTRHARFAYFLRGPRATWRYLVSALRGAAPATAGHNPLGAWMVTFLLLTLLAQGVTGLFANDEIFNTGPLYGYISDGLSLRLTSWHRRLFDWILIAVVLHVLAVIGHRVFAGHDLIGPMISGNKPAPLVAEHEAISSSRLWLALLLLTGLVATVSWFVVQAPAPAVVEFE